MSKTLIKGDILYNVLIIIHICVTCVALLVSNVKEHSIITDRVNKYAVRRKSVLVLIQVCD